MKKIAFRARSPGLYKLTHMPFGLSKSRCSYWHLTEQYLGDQQFFTLLLYLHDICIFAPSIDKMLDRIQLVFSRLKEFHLKIKPQKCHFFDASFLFLSHVLSARRISANPKKVEKVRNWPNSTNAKEYQNLLKWPMAYIIWLVWHPTEQKTAKVKRKDSWHQLWLKTRFSNRCRNIKQHLMCSKSLIDSTSSGLSRLNKEFVLETNASLQCLGAMLS